MAVVRHQRFERRQRSQITSISTVPSLCEIEILKATINPPGLKRIVGPGVTLIFMALRAGIGAANAERNIGSWYAHAVIAPRIDGHIDLRWHVASNAGASSTGH